MREKLKVEKGNVQETLLLPLWGRAMESGKDDPRLVDEKAVEIIEKIDYDFSEIEQTQAMSQHGWVARALHIDRMVRDFIRRHPGGTVVNVGCGLDTTFFRVDNGKMLFFELDLPDVIELRRPFIEESDRNRYIASSFLDTDWFDEITVNDGLLCVAGGVLYYFSEEEIRGFFKSLADRFDSTELFFDSLSPTGIKIAKKQVLKKGGMGTSMDGGWGLKSINSLEAWDDRFKVLNSIPISKGMNKGIPLKHRIIIKIPDLLGLCSMVHMRIGEGR